MDTYKLWNIYAYISLILARDNKYNSSPKKQSSPVLGAEKPQQ